MTGAILVRELAESDWDAIAALPDAILPDRRPENAEWLRNTRAFVGARARYVVERGNRLIGFGSLEAGADPRRVRIRLLMAGPDIRGGAAEPLLERLVADLDAADASLVWDRVDLDEPDLLEFYERAGFVRQEKEPRPYGSDFRFFTVARRIGEVADPR